MIHDTAGKIDEIIRTGGEFWLVEVSDPNTGDTSPRVWLRNTNRGSIKIELALERMRRPGLLWTPRRVKVVTEVEEP